MDETDFAQLSEGLMPTSEWQKVADLCGKALMPKLEGEATYDQVLNAKSTRFLISRSQKLMWAYIDLVSKKQSAPIDTGLIECINRFSQIPLFRDSSNGANKVNDCLGKQVEKYGQILADLSIEGDVDVDPIETWKEKASDKASEKFKSCEFSRKTSHLFQYAIAKTVSGPQLGVDFMEQLFDKATLSRVYTIFSKHNPGQQSEALAIFIDAAKNTDAELKSTRYLLISVALKLQIQVSKNKISSVLPKSVPIPVYTRNDANELVEKFSTEVISEETINRFQGYLTQLPRSKIDEKRSLVAQFIKKEFRYTDVEAQNMLKTDKFGNSLMYSCVSLIQWKNDDERWSFIDRIQLAASCEDLREKYNGIRSREQSLRLERMLNPSCSQTQIKCKMFAPHLITYLFNQKTTAFRNFAEIKGAPTCYRKCFPAEASAQKKHYEQVFGQTKELAGIIGDKAFQYFFKYHVDCRNDQWLSYLPDANLSRVNGRAMAIELFNNVICEKLFLTIATKVAQVKDQQTKAMFVEGDIYGHLKQLMNLNFDGWRVLYKTVKDLQHHPGGDSDILVQLRILMDKKLLANQIVFFGAIFGELDKAEKMMKEFEINPENQQDDDNITDFIMSIVCEHPIDFVLDEPSEIENEIVYLMANKQKFNMSEVVCSMVLSQSGSNPVSRLALKKLSDSKEAAKMISTKIGCCSYSVKFMSVKLHQLYQWLHREKLLDSNSSGQWLLDVYESSLFKKITINSLNKEKSFSTCSVAARADFYSNSLSYAANQFIGRDHAKNAAKCIVKAIVSKAGAFTAAKLILKYVSTTFQSASAGVKAYCGYLINTELKSLYDRNAGPQGERLIVNNYVRAKSESFTEGMILKPVFSSNGSQDISTNEYMQILSITNLTSYMVVAHSTAFSDVDKLRYFFIGAELEGVNSGLHQELIKIMKLQGTTPTYLKAMCRAFNMDASSVSSASPKDIFRNLSLIGDLDFEQIVPVAWSQMDENAKTATLLAAISSKSLRKLVVSIACDTDGQSLASLWTGTFKQLWPEYSGYAERPLYEILVASWGSLGLALGLSKLQKLGYSVAPTADKKLSTFCIAHAGKSSPNIHGLFKAIEQLDSKHSNSAASTAINSMVDSFSQKASLADIMIYVMLKDAMPADMTAADGVEQVDERVKARYENSIGNNCSDDLLAKWRESYNEADYAGWQDQATIHLRIYELFTGVARKVNEKLTSTDMLIFALSSEIQVLRKSGIFSVTSKFPKVSEIAQLAKSDSVCKRIAADLASIVKEESTKQHELEFLDIKMPNILLPFGLMLASLTKDSQLVQTVLSAAQSLDASKLESGALLFIMNEGEIKKLGGQINENACKQANSFCEKVLSTAYSLNEKRSIEEENKASYMGIIEIAEKHKDTLGKDPSPLCSQPLKLKKVTLNFSEKLIKSVFSGKPDESMAKFMKVCLAYDEMLIDVTSTHISSLFKKSQDSNIQEEDTRQKKKDKTIFNPFLDQIKNIQVVLHGENTEVKPLEAVLYLQIDSKLVQTPPRPYSKVDLPDEAAQKVPELNISVKTVFKVRVEDTTYTFDPSAKLHPSYYELQALKIKLDRLTRETREKYGEEALKEAILQKQDPFRKKISVIKYADRSYFQSTFGETFGQEPFLNQRFVAEYRLYLNVCSVLEQYRSRCFNGLQPADIIADNAVMLGAKQSNEVEEESRSIAVQLYADLPPRVANA